MSKLGNHRSAWKIQRGLQCELPGMGKPGALERRPYPPGQHGLARRKFSEYALRLREKQKIMFNYGLREEHLRCLVKKAKKGKSTDWMSTLIGLLETRLDSIIFRLGFAPSIPAARQLVLHGKVRVDGKKRTISSEQLKVGSEISLTTEGYQNTVYQYSIKQPRLSLPDHLSHMKEQENVIGKLKFMPNADAIPFPFEQSLVAEFYSGL